MNKYVKWGLIGCSGLIGIFLFFVIIVAAIGIGSVSNNNTEQNVNTTTNTSTKQVQKQKANYKIGDTVKAGDLEYTILNIEIRKVIKDPLGSEYRPGAGQYLILELQIKNTGKESMTADSNMFKLKDQNGAEYKPDGQADTWINGSGGNSLGFFLEPINPNATKTGKVAFDVPNQPADKFTFEGEAGLFSLKQSAVIQLKK